MIKLSFIYELTDTSLSIVSLNYCILFTTINPSENESHYYHYRRRHRRLAS